MYRVDEITAEASMLVGWSLRRHRTIHFSHDRIYATCPPFGMESYIKAARVVSLSRCPSVLQPIIDDNGLSSLSQLVLNSREFSRLSFRSLSSDILLVPSHFFPPFVSLLLISPLASGLPSASSHTIPNSHVGRCGHEHYLLPSVSL
jgi:hypothetical protein